MLFLKNISRNELAAHDRTTACTCCFFSWSVAVSSSSSVEKHGSEWDLSEGVRCSMYTSAACSLIDIHHKPRFYCCSTRRRWRATAAAATAATSTRRPGHRPPGHSHKQSIIPVREEKIPNLRAEWKHYVYIYYPRTRILVYYNYWYEVLFATQFTVYSRSSTRTRRASSSWILEYWGARQRTRTNVRPVSPLIVQDFFSSASRESISLRSSATSAGQVVAQENSMYGYTSAKLRQRGVRDRPALRLAAGLLQRSIKKKMRF